MDGGVGIELGDAGRGDLVARLADIVQVEEELGGKIGDGHGGGVVECEALDAGQGNVLCDLDTQALEADDQDIGSAHALHRLVAQDIELAAVEGLIDLACALGHDRLVDLHPGNQVDLRKPLVLWGEEKSVWLSGPSSCAHVEE